MISEKFEKRSMDIYILINNNNREEKKWMENEWWRCDFKMFISKLEDIGDDISS